MTNQEHLDMLKQGVEVWNQWRKEHPDIRPDLSNADLHETNLSSPYRRGEVTYQVGLIQANFNQVDLTGANLTGANLNGALLIGANLSYAKLIKASFQGANLSGALLNYADLKGTTFEDADLSKASFWGADLHEANLLKADLCEADIRATVLFHADLTFANLSSATIKFTDLMFTNLNGANLTNAIITDCRIYGISVWGTQLEGAKQYSLIITLYDEPTITVDNIQVAQFIHMLLKNKEIRDVIDTITSKVVLILGRFTPERKTILDAIRDELRYRNYIPMLFDFEKPVSRDLTETISILAHLARFIIADLTDPSSIPLELREIVPNLAVPVQPILLAGNREFSMFVTLRKYPWVLPTYFYQDQANLLDTLKEKVIEPAERKARELAKLKAEE